MKNAKHAMKNAKLSEATTLLFIACFAFFTHSPISRFDRPFQGMKSLRPRVVSRAILLSF
jgi:hypothetical protein